MHSTLPLPAPTADWLVVIARCEASVFRSVAPGAAAQLIRPPQSERKMGARPAPGASPRNEPSSRPPAFFEPLAGVLHGARRILIFGRVADGGSEADPFIRWLRGHRPAIAQRIVGSMWLEPDQTGEAGFLAQARDFFGRAVIAAPAEPACSPVNERPVQRSLVHAGRA